ncbi:putative NADH dehydrogenase [Gregarina niphandrodes]|uniref:NADH:ubiquinone reductase (non-electrogenic) n=1 Tax=Gregarina niphandrodes TaxID=110365 RepID=A0A023B8P2_GRENI|nr:putative NADH dehydrogenase [Gregarina niphandrodes]EZG69841.1 putative NADH dehydrogenase [Gregarina niphandrodes]|eukprot:XP_011129985.1 putative NADH dehydrogenase [Gregarina niphandrodes]
MTKQIDPSKYKVTVISPRPYFLFTPLLTGTISGSLSMRAIMEPIRSRLLWGRKRRVIQYVKAEAVDIDTEKHVVHCKDNEGDPLEVGYDQLAIGVGSVTNTFGIPGAQEHSVFVKDIADAVKIKADLLNLFCNAEKRLRNYQKGKDQGGKDQGGKDQGGKDQGGKDQGSKEEINIVVVGGGPAGVETVAEINDLIRNELRVQFPELAEKAKITIVEMLDRLLPQFKKPISKFATEKLETAPGVVTLLRHQVQKVDEKAVHLKALGTDEEKVIPYEMLVWASGVGQTCFARKLLMKLQPENRVLKVEPDLRLQGCERVFAFGDCAMVSPPSLADHADVFFSEAVNSNTGPCVDWLMKNRLRLLKLNYVQLDKRQWRLKGTLERWPLHQKLSVAQFKSLLKELDDGYKPPIPTAQIAKQAGGYLGTSLNRAMSKPKLIPHLPFSPSDSGAMSYIGDGNAVLNINIRKNTPAPKGFTIFGGRGSKLLWHGYYWLNQSSFYNRLLSFTDVILAGSRDLSGEPQCPKQHGPP